MIKREGGEVDNSPERGKNVDKSCGNLKENNDNLIKIS